MYPSIGQLGSSVVASFIKYVFVPLPYAKAVVGSDEKGDGYVMVVGILFEPPLF